MRVFITSYQKSGTHQIMPALGMRDDIVDRSWVDFTKLPERYLINKEINWDGARNETIPALRTFEGGWFGHIPYLSEYAEVLEGNTKVLFNVRDPRDVIVANYHSIKKVYYKTEPPGKKGYGHLNLRDKKGKLVIEKDDPISELIEIESCRWPEWLGWLNHNFVMQVKYEDLRMNPVPTIKKIEEFLKPYEINVVKSVKGLYPNHGNPTFRRGRVGDWKIEFDDTHKKLAEKLLGETIVKLGYEI